MCSCMKREMNLSLGRTWRTTDGALDDDEPSDASIALLTAPLIAAPDVFASIVEPCCCTEVSFWLSVPPLPLDPAAQLQVK